MDDALHDDDVQARDDVQQELVHDGGGALAHDDVELVHGDDAVQEQVHGDVLLVHGDAVELVHDVPDVVHAHFLMVHDDHLRYERVQVLPDDRLHDYHRLLLELPKHGRHHYCVQEQTDEMVPLLRCANAVRKKPLT